VIASSGGSGPSRFLALLIPTEVGSHAINTAHPHPGAGDATEVNVT
jgi:hypothetical protein